MRDMLLTLRILSGILMLGVVVAAYLHLYRRVIRTPAWPKWVKNLGWGAWVLLGLFTVAMFAARGRWTQTGTATAMATLWLAFTLNLLLVVLPLDILSWGRKKWRRTSEPVSEERRLFLARTMAASSALAAGGITTFGAFRAYEPARITEVVVKLPGLPKALEGFTLAHLSDVHIGPVLRQRFLDELVQRTNSVKPDLVAITGDLVDGTPAQLGEIVARLRNLHSRFGTHFVTGNHDYYSGAEAWVSALRGMGVQVLRNQHVSIGGPGASFDLLGVDDWGHGGLDGEYDLERAMAGRDPSRASVLLAHQPSNFDEVAKRGLGLQLSGHTHGGQMFPGTLVGSLLWGDRNAGLSRVGTSHLFVSRGCGFVGPAQRLGSPPEIAKVILLAG